LGDWFEAFEGVAQEVAMLLGCTGARMWVVDNLRQCLWTCVRGKADLPTIQLADKNGPGLAAAACANEVLVNVGNAREDPRFNEATDAAADGWARSVMCIPIFRPGKNKPSLVLQAMNKLLEPRFSVHTDGVILRLIGRVSSEVIDVCQTSSAYRANSKRREMLLQVFEDHMPCNDPVLLLRALEMGLAKMFQGAQMALHLAQTAPHKRTLLVQTETAAAGIPSDGGKVSWMAREGFRGIVGQVATANRHASLTSSQLRDSTYDCNVDIIVNVSDGIVHTFPISSEGKCIAVCQFVCPQSEGSMLVDDGCFHVENHEHNQLLKLLLNFVKKHLRLVELGGGSSSVPQFVEGKQEIPQTDLPLDKSSDSFEQWET